jgi:hypothetical protein
MIRLCERKEAMNSRNVRWCHSLILTATLQLIALTSVPAVTPDPHEFSLSRQWSDSLFSPDGQVSPRSSLRVVEEDSPDAITRGRSWRGTPFQIATKTYQHGLAFNSNKRLVDPSGPSCQTLRSDIGWRTTTIPQRGGKKQGSVIFQDGFNGKKS